MRPCFMSGPHQRSLKKAAGAISRNGAETEGSADDGDGDTGGVGGCIMLQRVAPRQLEN